jgi:hypothetical protein
MTEELLIDGEKDVVLVLRDTDFLLHLPPYEGEGMNTPPKIGTALALAACLYNNDSDFKRFMVSKYKQYEDAYKTSMREAEIVSNNEE